MSHVNFFKSRSSGDILYALNKNASGDCCDDSLLGLKVNTVDGAHEKHIPVISISDCCVCIDVGSVPHPMLKEHSIQWIGLETNRGVYFRYPEPGDSPKACFALTEGEKAIAACEYCNLHGLWAAYVE